LSADLDLWLTDLADQRRKPATIETYTKRSQWIRQHFGVREWSQITEPELRRAIDAASRRESGAKLAPDTIRLVIIAWDQFQRWAIDTGRLEAPINRRPLRKPQGTLRQRLPPKEELQRIIRAANPAFRMIYRTLLLTGARPDELCRATIADYDPLRQMIRLADHKTVGKTKRPRLIPVSAHCRVVIRQAIGDRRTGPIFLSRRGKPWSRARLSEHFRRLRDRLGLDRQIVLYATRHTAATEILRKRGAGAAAAVLGHSGLQTIQRYLHPDERDLVNWVESGEPATT
jgi:integrase